MSSFFIFNLEVSRCELYNLRIRSKFVKQQTAGAENIMLPVESLPFSKIPNQSKLFIDYQTDATELIKYYPLAVRSHTQIADIAPKILAEYKADRALLCDVLQEANIANGAGAETLKNLELLRDEDCVAVVSGQQAGLFTGPLYTIYKALSAVKETECLRGRGIKAVPVFWIATEDHDFLEVSKTEIIGSDGEIVKVVHEPKRCYENLPVGYVKIDDSIVRTIEDLFSSLPHTEFTEDLKAAIDETWHSGMEFGDAFAQFFSKIVNDYGLILLCPLDERLKKLATPIYVEAIRKSEEIVDALIKRSEELVEAGYHAQVLITPDYFPLFWQSKDRTRHALKKNSKGTYKVKDLDREFTLEELAEIAQTEPQRFSPSVVLRSVVQDYLLPTVCYFGGAAEIAYFAQSAEVYRILDRPVTPILHRQSFTIIEPKHAKTLDKYNLEISDLFDGINNILPRIVENYLNLDTAKVFAEVEEKINIQLNHLDNSLAEIEPTLAESLANRRRKIIYHIGNLRNKFHKSQLKKDEIIHRRIESLFNSVVPNKHLQERSLNITSFLDRYGVNLIDWIYQSIDLDDKDHRVIYI